MAGTYVYNVAALARLADQQSAPGVPGAAATTAVDFPDGPAKALWASADGLATLHWDDGAAGEVSIATFQLFAGPNPIYGVQKATFTGFSIWPLY